jgi:hypothetical protein
MSYQAALRRIYRNMAVIGAIGAVAAWGWQGWRFGLGFLIGAAVGALNFHWLKGAVDVLTAKLSPQAGFGSPPAPWRAGARFLLRYGLLGATAYGILATSLVSLTGFLGGLFVFAAAILAEIAYELLAGFDHA